MLCMRNPRPSSSSDVVRTGVGGCGLSSPNTASRIGESWSRDPPLPFGGLDGAEPLPEEVCSGASAMMPRIGTIDGSRATWPAPARAVALRGTARAGVGPPPGGRQADAVYDTKKRTIWVQNWSRRAIHWSAVFLLPSLTHTHARQTHTHDTWHTDVVVRRVHAGIVSLVTWATIRGDE